MSDKQNACRRRGRRLDCHSTPNGNAALQGAGLNEDRILLAQRV